MAEEKENEKNNDSDELEEENESTQEVEEQGSDADSEEDEDEEEEEDEENEEGDEAGEEQAPQGPRFDTVDVLFYMGLSILSDILDGLWITRFFFGPVIISWLFLKGVNGVGKNVISQAIELIPVVDWLPITTVAAVVTIWSTNNPESFNKVFGIAGKILKARKAA